MKKHRILQREKRTFFPHFVKHELHVKRYISVFPRKPFKYGYQKLVPAHLLPCFGVQKRLTYEQKELVLQFTGGVWNLRLLKALLFQRCKIMLPDELTWNEILNQIEIYLGKKQSGSIPKVQPVSSAQKVSMLVR